MLVITTPLATDDYKEECRTFDSEYLFIPYKIIYLG
jgi:hypothetical protein